MVPNDVPISFTAMKSALIVLLATVATPAAARGTVVYADGAWAAIDRGAVCEALTRSQKIAPKDKVQATAGITFSRDHRHWGEFHVRLSRMPRGDASVMLHIGDQPFLLLTRGGWAWSRGPVQSQGIIAAMRDAAAMRVESRDMAGVRFAQSAVVSAVGTR